MSCLILSRCSLLQQWCSDAVIDFFCSMQHSNDSTKFSLGRTTPKKLPVPIGGSEPNPIHGSSGLPESASKMAPWSVPLFLHDWASPTDIQTGHVILSVASSRILLLLWWRPDINYVSTVSDIHAVYCNGHFSNWTLIFILQGEQCRILCGLAICSNQGNHCSLVST